jgi:hypothetical protein
VYGAAAFANGVDDEAFVEDRDRHRQRHAFGNAAEPRDLPNTPTFRRRATLPQDRPS